MFGWFDNPFFGYEEDPREAQARRAAQLREQRLREEQQRQYEEQQRLYEERLRRERQEREERARQARRRARAPAPYPDFLSSFFGYPPSESSESATARGYAGTDAESSDSLAPRPQPQLSYRPRAAPARPAQPAPQGRPSAARAPEARPASRPATAPSGPAQRAVPRSIPRAIPGAALGGAPDSASQDSVDAVPSAVPSAIPSTVSAAAPREAPQAAPHAGRSAPRSAPRPAQPASRYDVVGDLSQIREPEAPPPAEAFRTYSRNAAARPAPARPTTSPLPVPPGEPPAAWEKQEVIAHSSADSSLLDADAPGAPPEISETSGYFLIQIPVSDVDRGAIAVELNARNELTVRAHQGSRGGEIAIERKYTLPSHLVDRTDVSAKLEGGILRIHIPKTQDPDLDILKIEVE